MTLLSRFNVTLYSHLSSVFRSLHQNLCRIAWQVIRSAFRVRECIQSVTQSCTVTFH